MSWTEELPVRLPQPSKENSWEDNPIPSELPNRQSLGTKRRQAALKYPFQPFPANIEIAEDDITAIKFARAEYIPEYDFVESSKGQRMVLWSNSKSGRGNSRYGIGITYMQSGNRWVDLEYLIQRDVKDWVAEIAAISKALQIAAEEVFRAETKPKILVIYTGSRQALERLNKGIVGVVPGQKFLLKPGILAAEKIRDSGVVVELRWGPDTELLQGSRRARHAARRAANYTPSRRQVDTVLEVKSITRQARARARTRFRPTAIVLPDDQISDLDLDKQELTVK
ncbi:uncharacterized protein RAG0_03519 [Rhynchosporium agropyri]|uniref:RNase H type-1 domain-containing protein n=1 Tax=Rhynchosporium agropyri TaxID=914238 RepID=A0A1E1K4L2_9HELO|nr:uncharacterized protein RAG0_03519 [Rhynchosporium agropyri]